MPQSENSGIQLQLFSHCFAIIYSCSPMLAPSSNSKCLNSRVQIRIFFQNQIIITSHHHHYHHITHLFLNHFIQEADTPSFVFKSQELKNHTDEGSLSKSRVVVALLASLNQSNKLTLW